MYKSQRQIQDRKILLQGVSKETINKSQLWLTSHPRSTVVLLNTGTHGTSREIYSEDADDEFYSEDSPSPSLLSDPPG